MAIKSQLTGFLKIIKKVPIKLNEVFFIKNCSKVDNFIIEPGIVSKNCSTSLELGIDIGTIDAVVQISSPKSVTRAIQRIGRSGHSYYDTSRGYIISVSRDDLIENTVIAKGILERKLDKIHIPKNCLDVLVQHIIGMALEKKWDVDEAYNVIKRSYVYKDLKKEDFISLLRYLSGKYVELTLRKIYAKIWYDEEDNKFGRRGKMLRVILFTNTGTIPEEVKIDVYLRGTRKYLGSIEEEFLERLRPGDIFVLGGKPYLFVYSKGTKAFVENAIGQNPTIPAWFSELLPLSFDTALEVGKFRRIVKEKILKEKREDVIKWIVDNYPVERKEATIIYEYIKEQLDYVGVVPNDKELLIEESEDLKGRKLVIFHFLFGRRVNNLLSRVIAYMISRKIYSNILIYLNDYGFAFILPRYMNIDFEKLLKDLTLDKLEEYARKAIRHTELFRIRFRHVANRGLLVLRAYGGKKIKISKQQLRAETLLNVLERFSPDFPLIKETYREILEDVMDIENARKVLNWIKNGEVCIKKAVTPIPSPFAHNLIVFSYEDILRIEERQKILRKLHDLILEKINKPKYYKK